MDKKKNIRNNTMYTQGQVSIIIPCYNMEPYLAETLDSVASQTYNNWECIIIDDGSTDNTELIVNNYCNNDNRFRYIKQENKGVSAARNNGIKQANGEFILPLDGDDIIEKTYIEKAVNYISTHPETKLVYCKAAFIGQKTGEWKLEEYSYEKHIWVNCIFCSAFFRHCDFDLTNGYNTNMKNGLEDWDFWLTLLKENDIVYRIDEVLFWYRIRNNSRNNTTATKAYLELMQQIYNNHIDIYKPYTNNILYLKNRELTLSAQLDSLNKKIQVMAQDYQEIKQTFSFKLGKFLTAPFRWIKKKIT